MRSYAWVPVTFGPKVTGTQGAKVTGTQESFTVQSCFMCLAVLVSPRNAVEFTVFYKLCTGLVIVKGDVVFDALIVEIFHPGEIADSGIGTGFSAGRYKFNDRAAVVGFVFFYIRAQVDGA